VDQLNAYEGNYEPLHYTMKFIDGLKPEFKSAVLMQRPSTLVCPCSFAGRSGTAIQEERLWPL
jgi:hypothetical protein